MAAPNLQIKLLTGNIFQITSLETVDTAYYSIYSLDTNGTTYTQLQDFTEILEGDVVNYTAPKDNIYRFDVKDLVTPTTIYSYLLLADGNLQACKRKLILTNLCSTSFGCDPNAQCDYLNMRMKFYDLESGLYYLYYQLVTVQSISEPATVFTQNLMDMSFYIQALNTMCGCTSDNCEDCSNGSAISDWNVIQGFNSFNPDCGCNS